MRFLVRNWHLKVSAVMLATVLYTGLVFSGSLSEGTVQLPIRISGDSSSAFVLSGDPGTVEVTYRVARDSAGAVRPDSFAATVDLSAYDLDRAPRPQILPVDVEAIVDDVEIVSQDPMTVTVALDRVEEKVVPVQVDYGTVPDTLEVRDPQASLDEVTVRGAASFVSQVDRAVARVLIDESGIDVHRTVALEPVDVEGQPVPNVEAEPQSVSVDVDVRPVETSSTVPVRPRITGTPAPGFALEALRAEPTTVTIRGLPETLAEITEVQTEPLSMDGLTETQSFETALVLPEGVRVDAGQEVVTVSATIGPSVSSRTFVLGVVCQGAGDNACLPALDQLTVTLSGPGEVLSELTAAQLTPVLDAGGLPPGTHEVSPVVVGLPEGVELLGIVPGRVEVTIAAPAPPPTPPPTPAPTASPTPAP